MKNIKIFLSFILLHMFHIINMLIFKYVEYVKYEYLFLIKSLSNIISPVIFGILFTMFLSELKKTGDEYKKICIAGLFANIVYILFLLNIDFLKFVITYGNSEKYVLIVLSMWIFLIIENIIDSKHLHK